VEVHRQRRISSLPAVHKERSLGKGAQEKDSFTRNRGSTAAEKATRKKIDATR
jgi:hypothetical protein